MTRRRSMAVLTAALLGFHASLAACSDQNGPAIAFEGGGFIFNYRIAEVFYGVAVKPLRRLDAGTVLVAEFENPAGGKPFTVTEPITGTRTSYGLRTPELAGVKAGRPYRVVVRAVSATGAEIARIERTFTSDLDQEMSPQVPLTIGPGYTPNPAAAGSSAQPAKP
jgi:hypothetical protein